MGYRETNLRERTAIHVRDIVSVESRELAKGRTVIAVLGTGALIFFVALIVWAASLPSNY